MRTEITAELAGTPVRAVVTCGALIDIASYRDDFRAVIGRCASGNVGDIMTVLKAVLRAAGDLEPLEVAAEAPRLIEQAGLAACGEFCVRLLQDAFDKAEQSAGESPAPEAATTPPAKDG